MEIKKYTLAIVLFLVSFTLWAGPVCTVYEPSTTNAQRCGAGELTLTAVSANHQPAIIAKGSSVALMVPPGGGGSLTTRWYYDASGGTYFATGTYLTVNLSTTTVYYATTFNSASPGCESARVPVTGTISLISTASAGPNQNICTLGGGVTLAANSPSHGTGAWSVSSGPSTSSAQFSSTSSPSATFTAAGGEGVYNLKWTITSSGCTPSSSTMSLTLNQAPTTSNAGPNQIGGSTCGQTSVTLAANSPTIGTGTWSIAVDSPVPPGYTFGGLHNPGLNDPHTVFNGTPGVGYNLVWTITNGPCSSSDETIVMFNQAPTSSSAGSNQSICSDTPSATLSANTPAVGTGSWIVTSGPSLAASQFSNASSPSATFTPIGGTGVYGLSWVISSPAGSSCPASSSGVSITVNLKPVITGTDNHVTMNKAVRLKTEPGATYDWRNGSNVQVSTRDSLVTRVIDTYTVTVVRPGIGGACTSNPFAVVKQTDGMNLNYIISTAVTVKGITNAADVPNLSVDSASQTIQYFDGIGRPIQTVTTQGSPLKKDNVQPIVYDPYGREVIKYLPYVASSYNGRMKTDFLPAENSGYNTNPQYLFYQNTPKVSTDTKPYANTTFETDPRNRPAKDYSAGAAWSNKPVRHAYLLNQHGTSANQEKIIAWMINGSNLPVHATTLTGYIEINGFYSNGQLAITQTKDEQGNAVREYTDKQGRVILKKVQAIASDSTSLNSSNGWALTYYIYDEVGNLRFVLPPELSKRAHSSDTYLITTTDLNNWAFQYKYDARNRMVEKRVPGAESVYMVYDLRDRLVLTQDGIQRSLFAPSKYLWSFTKYDELNRPIMIGIKDTTASLSQVQMQGAVNAHYAKLTSRLSENYMGAGTQYVHGYSNKAYPARTGAATEIDPNKYLSVTYYDNYSYKAIIYDSVSYSFVTTDLTGDSDPNSNQKTNYFRRLAGQVTGTKTKVLDGGITGGYTWLKTVNYYDDKGSLIQVISDNYKGGTDRTTNALDFAGKVMKTKSTQVERDVTWKDIVNAQINGNILMRPAPGGGWGSSGAASVQQLPAGQNGWIEVTASPVTDVFKMVGLSDANTDASYTSIDFSLYQNGTTLSIYEGPNYVTQFLGILVPGDILRIERVGTSILYKRNGLTLFTSQQSSTSILMADAAINTSPATLVGVRSSFSTTSHSTIRRFAYDHAGRLLKTYHKLDAESEKLLVQNEYNALGQLIDKKLYSTNNGATFRQSQDYRYNIRGWLTKINESDVNNNESGDPRDLFGMELLYNQEDAGIGNSGAFNGNISAIKWSRDQSFGTKKENAYSYGYDPMNRIKTATFKEKSSSWALATNSGFSESGYEYDLNGNILSLVRYDKRGTTAPLDNLVYNDLNYTSNKLMKVTDSADDFGGFVDGTNTGDDYTYDVNGNMITDQNKGIITAIGYNYMNLPETISKGGISLQYIYDASGRKLAQVVTSNTKQKQTEYSGEYQYEDDVLQFIGHEEGRITMSSTQTMFSDDATVTANFTSVNTTLSTVTQGTEKYVKVVSNGTTGGSGVFPIGGTILVTAGDRYKIRTRAYRDKGTAASSSGVYLSIKANGTSVDWPGALLPISLATASNEMWTEQVVTMPAGATTLQTGLIWSSVLAGEAIYINDFEITKLTTNATPEYQFNLKDHLGNVRVSFTTKTDIEVTTGTLETANATVEQSQYLRYTNAKKVNAAIFDHTNGASAGYSERLNGSANEKYGLARSLSVMPGDSIKLEVYAKYIDPNSSNWTGVLSTLVSQIAANTAGVVVDGTAYASSTSSFPSSMLGHQSTDDNGAPRAYLNWLIFDRNYGFITGGFKQITTAAKEAGTDVAHEKVVPDIPIAIEQPGYVYVYLSNEEATYTREVYFDDFKVTHVKSPVIETQDYYPFGLRFNSYSRENGLPNKMKLFQGQEHVDDLGLNWDSFKWRNHQPDIGRFFNVDPLAAKYVYNSPYAFSENHVTTHIELEGLEKVYIFDQQNNPDDKKVYTADVYVQRNSGVVNGPYKGSSFPNKPASHNEVKSGEHQFNNESGHKGGTKKGLNLVNAEGERKSPGTAPGGTDVEMTVVNVHSGVKPEDNGGQENRGSEGCPTIAPGEAGEFFKNFDFSNGTTGNAEGTVTIFRGESDDSKNAKKDLQFKQEIQNFDTKPPVVKADATSVQPPVRRNQ